MPDDSIGTLIEWVRDAKKIVFFGGAGVSTESGIPDFRGTGGLYSKTYDDPPEVILSHRFFMQKPLEFFRFYQDKMIFSDILPNMCHLTLAKLETAGQLIGVITQNIDGLHQLAGSKKVLELHGSIYRNHCLKCHKTYGLEVITSALGIPRCDCGGIIRPDVVLYGETLDQKVLDEAIGLIKEADLLIIGGTSLSVYPAASLIQNYHNGRLVLINRTETAYDTAADLIIKDPIGTVFSKLDAALKR